MMVCADDYGLSEDINGAVLKLVDERRLSAVSCMMNAPAVNSSAMNAVFQRKNQVEIGLHLCLTDFFPCSQPHEVKSLVSGNGLLKSLSGLFRRSITGKIETSEVSLEIKRQYERFLELTGNYPDFIDGHLHVHQFPGIRSGLLMFLNSRRPGEKPIWVRNSYLPTGQITRQGVSRAKCFALACFGRSMLHRLEKNDVSTNHGFNGIYDYRRYQQYEKYLERFAACSLNPDSLMMAHPGMIEPWRKSEYDALLKADWISGRLNRFPREAGRS